MQGSCRRSGGGHSSQPLCVFHMEPAVPQTPGILTLYPLRGVVLPETAPTRRRWGITLRIADKTKPVCPLGKRPLQGRNGANVPPQTVKPTLFRFVAPLPSSNNPHHPSKHKENDPPRIRVTSYGKTHIHTHITRL